MENESLYFVIVGEYLYYGTEDVIKKLDDTSVKEHPNKIWYYGLHDRLPLIMYKVYPIEKLTELDLGHKSLRCSLTKQWKKYIVIKAIIMRIWKTWKWRAIYESFRNIGFNYCSKNQYD